VSEQRITRLAQHRAIDNAAHIAPPGHFHSRYLNLSAMPVAILNGRPIHHAIHTRPQCRAHTHRAGLARRVKRVSGQRNTLEPLGREAYGSHLGVRAGIELSRHSVPRLDQQIS